MFNAVKRIITTLFFFLLLYLFTVPGLYVSRLADDLDTQCRAAELAVFCGEDPTEHLISIRNDTDRAAKKLHLFLNHDSVDTLLSAVHALPPMREPDTLLPALEAVRAELVHLRAIETLNLYTLF